MAEVEARLDFRGRALRPLGQTQAVQAGDRGARGAVKFEDSLKYDEPPSWQLPTRLNLGAVQLEAGMPAEAAKTYREELEKFPDNGWSLVGLAAALDAQGKKGQAEELRARLAEAWRNADFQLTSSRF